MLASLFIQKLRGREQYCQSETPEYCINDYKERIIDLSHPEFLLPPREATIRRALATLRAIKEAEDVEKITTESNREAISKMSCRL